MLKLTTQKILLLILASLAVACSPEKEEFKTRTFVEPKSPGQGTNNVFKPVHSPVAQLGVGTTTDACTRIEELSMMGVNDPMIRNDFAIFETFNYQTNEAQVYLGNPFTEFVLTENIEVPGDEEFFQLATDRYNSGQLSWLEYNALKLAKSANNGIYRKLKYGAVNDEVESAMPGLFAEGTAFDKSLYGSLMKKATDLSKLDPSFINKYMTQEMPLFTSRVWSTRSQEMATSLRSALAGVYGPENTFVPAEQKLCGFILMQRLFGQLLALKGYEATLPKSNGRLAKIDSEELPFDTYDVFGGFTDPQGGSVILSPDEIANYSPAKPLVLNPRPETQGKELEELLSYIESMTYILEATSPVNSWVADNDYLFGDTTNPESPALAPAEAHSLALGLLLIGFKNLAAQNIVFTNAKGQRLAEGESAAGFALINPSVSTDETQLSIKNVTSLFRTVVYLSDLLDRMSQKTPDYLESMNGALTKSTLAQLLGRTMFAQEELDEILGPDGQGSILRNSLTDLQLPLVLMIKRFATMKGFCATDINWNLKTGQVAQDGQCSREDVKEVISALSLLGNKTRTQFLVDVEDDPEKAVDLAINGDIQL